MNKKGFTLVELVITIAIVIILSVISVPIYRGYTDKAKMAEGYALLGLICSAQKNYYSEYGLFLVDTSSSAGSNLYTCNDEVLGIDARSNKYYTYFTTGTWNAGMKISFVARVKAESFKELFLKYDITSGTTIG